MSTDAEETQLLEKRLVTADARVVQAFPRLAHQPTYPDRKPKCTPNRLYRSIIPTYSDNDNSIAFVGAVDTTQSFAVAEVLALWVAAHFMGKLAHKKEEQMGDEVALQVAWRRRRYLGDGETFIFEQL
jgi:dimethylaniline monooxygenase (N-oxide forming)